MNIIAVDDELLQLETITEYLAELCPDAEVRAFYRVSDVLKYIETETVELAVLDIEMPGATDGIQLGEILRQKNDRVRLVYCTASSEYAGKIARIHADGYLRKLVIKAELEEALRHILRMPELGERGSSISLLKNNKCPFRSRRRNTCYEKSQKRSFNL